MSNTEYLLNALKTGEDVSGFIPQSRQEEILKRICLKESLDDLVPLSRVECLLIEAAENITSGGGGGEVKVTVHPKMIAKPGTPLPVNEHVDKIYFNTTASVEEVVDEVKFQYPDISTFQRILFQNSTKGVYYMMYYIDINQSSATIPETLLIIKYQNSSEGLKGTVIFNSRILDMNEYQGTRLYRDILPKSDITTQPSFVGWNPDLINPEEVNCVNMTNDVAQNSAPHADDYYIYDIQDINEVELNCLVSTEEFETVASGTPIPPTEFIDEIYFNTDLSIEEVVNIMKEVCYDDSVRLVQYRDNNNGVEYTLECYHEFDEFDRVVIWMYSYDAVNDIEVDETIFVSYELTEEEKEGWDSAPDFVGWNPKLTNPIKVGLTNQMWDPFPYEIAQIASITPFKERTVTLSGDYDGASIEVTENGTIDIESLLKKNKLPLKINVSISTEQ